MHRCLIRDGDWSSRTLELSEPERHHLLRVMRARRGEAVLAFDGRGRQAPAIVADERKGILERTGEPVCAPRPACELILIQAIPKGARLDLVVEKVTELGVASIWPVITERTVVRLDRAARIERAERWGRVAASAARQCGSCWLPEVRPVVDYADGLAAFGKEGLLLVGSLQPGARPMRDILAEAAARRPARAGMIIGPEGDLTPDEIRLALEMGAAPVSFGSTVLRTDTAGIFAASCLACHLLHI